MGATRAQSTLHEPAHNRESWAPRATDAWYLGPAKEHYRCYQFYLPETGGYRISGAAKFFPEWCTIPEHSEFDKKVDLVEEILAEINNLKNRETKCNESRHYKAMQLIKDIYHGTHSRSPRLDNNDSNVILPSLSNNPTAPRAVKTTPWQHQRTTRNNIPPLVMEPMDTPQATPIAMPNTPVAAPQLPRCSP